MKKFVWVILATVSLMACDGSDSSRVEDIAIFPFKAPCIGVSQQLCFVTGESESQRDLFYNQVEGFEFEWGHAYELSVRVTNVSNPPADGSSLRYQLIEVISETETTLGSRFGYQAVDLLENTITFESNTYYFLSQPFSCAQAINCETLLAMNNSGGSVNLRFEYLGEGEIALVDWN